MLHMGSLAYIPLFTSSDNFSFNRFALMGQANQFPQRVLVVQMTI